MGPENNGPEMRWDALTIRSHEAPGIYCIEECRYRRFRRLTRQMSRVKATLRRTKVPITLASCSESALYYSACHQSQTSQ